MEFLEEESSCSLSPESEKIRKQRGPNKVKGEVKKQLYQIIGEKLRTLGLDICGLSPQRLKELFEEDVKKLTVYSIRLILYKLI